jgi:molybdopterin-guanine dinucleotide biosynthesis protein A
MPFVTGALLRALVDAARDGAEAVLPLGAGGHPEPVCAYYAPACLTVAERLLDAGERRASALGDAVGARHLEASAWGDPASLFFSVNTPADLVTAQAMAAR